MAIDAREGSPASDLERVNVLLDLYRTDLGRWEVEFLTSIKTALVEWGRLTPRQGVKLEEIWQRTGGKRTEGEEPEGRWA